MNLKNHSNDILLERYKDLGEQYKIFSQELEKVLKKFTDIRSELVLIEFELKERNLINESNAII